MNGKLKYRHKAMSETAAIFLSDSSHISHIVSVISAILIMAVIAVMCYGFIPLNKAVVKYTFFPVCTFRQ